MERTDRLLQFQPSWVYAYPLAILCSGGTVSCTAVSPRTRSHGVLDTYSLQIMEWAQFQDELDLKRKKVVPLDWIQNSKAEGEDAARVSTLTHVNISDGDVAA